MQIKLGSDFLKMFYFSVVLEGGGVCLRTHSILVYYCKTILITLIKANGGLFNENR